MKENKLSVFLSLAYFAEPRGLKFYHFPENVITSFFFAANGSPFYKH